MAYGTINADVIQSSVSGVSLGAGNATSFKNRIINGQMQIAQRSVGPVTNSTSNTSLLYDCMDRWGYWSQSGSLFSTQQSSVAPVGFSNSVLITSLAASTIGSTFYAQYSQRIEAFNYSDLMWGTANAKTITVSFWVRSSLTGTFSGYIFNNGYQYCYPFNYTISSANTWEQKSITIAGPTAGTWATTGNNIGLEIGLTLGAGSNYIGTPNTWTASNFIIAGTGATNLLATNGATLYMTGFQVEVGSSATGFDYRSYGTELALCQRYYFQSPNINNNTQFYAIHGYVASGGNVRWFFKIPVPMRTTPSIALNPVYNTGTWYANLTGIDNFAFTAAPSIGNYDGGLQLSISQNISAISASYYTFNVILYPVTGLNTNNFQISAEL